MSGVRVLLQRSGIVLALLTLSIVAAACASSSSSSRSSKPVATAASNAAATVRANPPAQSSTGLQPVIASSELVVGPNRFTMGVLDRSGNPIPDARVHLRFFQLQSAPSGGTAQGVLKFETDAVFRSPARDAGLPPTETVIRPDGTRIEVQSGGDDVGVYAAMVTFDQAGNWGVEAQVNGSSPDKSGVVRTNFKVLSESVTPAIGSPAPPSHNLTTKDVSDLSIIDTSAHPSPDMHTETIADAIAAHRPTLVLFATPGYCTSRLCGPELEIARKLEPKYKGTADFIHVEIYKDPATRTLMPAVEEWRLQSEPWFFIIDRNGNIAAKFEGPTTMEELDAALQKVVS